MCVYIIHCLLGNGYTHLKLSMLDVMYEELLALCLVIPETGLSARLQWLPRKSWAMPVLNFGLASLICMADAGLYDFSIVVFETLAVLPPILKWLSLKSSLFF